MLNLRTIEVSHLTPVLYEQYWNITLSTAVSEKLIILTNSKESQIPVFHGFRKFFTKQLVESKLNPEIREVLLGHKIRLASCYYKPTEQEMLNEYLKAVGLLTINEEKVGEALGSEKAAQKAVEELDSLDQFLIRS